MHERPNDKRHFQRRVGGGWWERTRRTCHVLGWVRLLWNSEQFQTHKLEFGLSAGRYSNRLETVLSRNVVVKPKERLMRLNTSSSVLLGNLKRDSQDVLRTELDWRGFFGERDTKVRTSVLVVPVLCQCEMKGDTYVSERICSPWEEETVNLGDWRVRTAAQAGATTPNSNTSIEDFMMKVTD